MPRFIIALVLLAACLIQANHPEERDPWFAYQVGDWVILEQTTIRAGQATETRRIKKVRTDRLDLGVAVSIYVDEGDGFSTEEVELRMHDAGILPDNLFEQTTAKPTRIDINGQQVDCEYVEYSFDRPGVDKLVSIKEWRSPTVQIPYRELSVLGPDMALMPTVLRMDYEVFNRSATQNATVRVTSLDAVVDVGNEAIVCIYEEGKAQVNQGDAVMTGDFKRWLSPKIPGGLVKFESDLMIQGQPVKLLEHVLDYGYGEAPPAPAAPKPAVTPESTAQSGSVAESTMAIDYQLTLMAAGDTHLLIKAVDTNESLPDVPKSMSAGEEIVLTADGPIMIATSNIEYLTVRIGNQTFRADGASGARKWFFNQDGPYTP